MLKLNRLILCVIAAEAGGKGPEVYQHNGFGAHSAPHLGHKLRAGFARE